MKDDFDLDSYFESGREVKLPGIGEKISLPRNAKFRYEGEVDSIPDSLARTELIIRGRLQPAKTWTDRVLNRIFDPLDIFVASMEVRRQMPDYCNVAAYCHPHKLPSGQTGYVIAVRKGLDKSEKIFAKGHESGELLAKIDQRDVMQKLVNEAGVSFDVSPLLGEPFADVGGALALRKAVEAGQEGIVFPDFGTRESVSRVLAEAFGF